MQAIPSYDTLQKLQGARPSWNDPTLDPRYFWIYVGSFFDRFGAEALNVTSSTDPVVQGLVTLIMPRSYVDLRRPDLPGLLDHLVQRGLINATRKAAVLARVTTEEERVTPGLPQPI